MSKVLFVVGVGIMAMCCNAIQRTPEQIAAIKAKRAQKLLLNGGLVTKQQEGNSIRIVNTQKKIPQEYIQQIAKDINSGLHVPIEVTEMVAGKCVFEDAEKALKLPKTGVVLLVVDDEKLPVILSAPENAWAVLNVRTLDDDMPPKEVYDVRVRKEVNRALAAAFGAGIAFNKPCVMEHVYSKTDLDNIKIKVVGPETISKMLAGGRMRNINPIKTTTYRKACEEGWAPMPTNEYQKAIWEKSREVPKNPMQIKFDPKTGK